MNRRNFMATMLAAGTAPAFIKIGNLMRPAPLWYPLNACVVTVSIGVTQVVLEPAYLTAMEIACADELQGLLAVKGPIYYNDDEISLLNDAMQRAING